MNLQSSGQGIAALDTVFSIGLGQSQEFTVILQTIAQLAEIYGENIEKILKGNINNAIFLKSTDIDMIQQLEQLSGKTHVVRNTSQTLNRDRSKVFNQMEGTIGTTRSREEVPVISSNDMLGIAPNNMILFRAGDPVVWNRNQTIMPMSWKLFGGDVEKTITNKGRKYSLQTVPTLSTAKDFDLRKNQPDFFAMMEHRINQAMRTGPAKAVYKEVKGLSDVEIMRNDPEVYANDIMTIIRGMEWEKRDTAASGVISDEPDVELQDVPDSVFEDGFADSFSFAEEDMVDNVEVQEEAVNADAIYQHLHTNKYAGKHLSIADLVGDNPETKVVNHANDDLIISTFIQCLPDFEKDSEHFEVRDGSLYDAETGAIFIRKLKDGIKEMASINASGEDPESRTFIAESLGVDDINVYNKYEVTENFYRYLTDLNSWSGLAGGRFEATMAEFVTYRDDERNAVHVDMDRSM